MHCEHRGYSVVLFTGILKPSATCRQYTEKLNWPDKCGGAALMGMDSTDFKLGGTRA